MKSKNLIAAAVLAASGMTCGIAQAQVLINVSGATLFSNFFRAPASTIDFIDADGNGNSRQLNNAVQQLVPNGIPNAGPWSLQYRGVGSGNGVGDLQAWGQNFQTAASGAGTLSTATGTLNPAYCNRTAFADSSGIIGPFNTGNPGASPLTSTTVAPFTALYAAPNTNSGGGVRIDAAIVDVPVRWFVRISGTTSEVRTPGVAGYGNFAGLGKNADGSSNTQNNLLRALTATTPVAYTTNVNITAPDANTMFDTPVASATIGVITNFGVGKTQTTYSELRHLDVTGRLPSGENLVFVTRDAGSGTRNGFCNSIGHDPSWGVGENVGTRTGVQTTWDLVGPNFRPSYKGSSGLLELTVQNSRLAVGYAGTERATDSPAYLSSGNVDFLAVKNDLAGGTVFARPDIDAVLDNNVNGYNISGPETFVTLGDPRNALEIGGTPGNTNPRMRNPAAAAYLNNITRSIEAFNANPSGDESTFSPAEYLGTRFVLVNSTDFVPNPNFPGQIIPNPNFNQTLQDYTRGISSSGGQGYRQFGFYSSNGKVPNRETIAGTYTDGSNGDYRDMNNNVVIRTNVLSDRNRISGDFNGDALRNADDIAGMIAAWKHRNGGPTWNAPAGNATLNNAAGSTAVIEILGDFNNDGNFNRHDVRYFADGLAIATAANNSDSANIGRLDRKIGFTLVDSSFGGNFFGTVLATGKTYAAGDSRGDVANSTGLQTVGYNPIGAEGPSTGTNSVPAAQRNRIDGWDIDYVYAQFKTNSRAVAGQIDWAVEAQALGADLSCDITGDLKINQADVNELVTSVLGTSLADVNLDGLTDGLDRAIIVARISAGGTTLAGSSKWSQGDLNGDGVVSDLDLSIWTLSTRCSPADIAYGDGEPLPPLGANGGFNPVGPDGGDFDCFFNAYFAPEPDNAACDIAYGDGEPLPPFGVSGGFNPGVDGGDFDCFFNYYFSGCL